MSSDIKLSVCIVTYNHEKFIAECLQGLVDQITDFRFEIIVGEDCSSDGTREIVKKFQQSYPDIVKPLYHQENLGAVENAKKVYRAAQGDYICHIDGDDGALPGKLQYIVSVFESLPEVVMVTHDMIVKDINSTIVSNSLRRFKPGLHDINDLVRNLPFFTNSAKAVRRKACVESLDLLHNNAVDVELHLLEAQHGKIFHIDSAFGYYRTLTGVSSSLGRVNPLVVDGYVRAFKGLMNNQFLGVCVSDGELIKLYALSLLKFSYQSLFFGRSKDAKDYAAASLRIKIFSVSQYLLLISSYLGPITVFLVRFRSRYKN